MTLILTDEQSILYLEGWEDAWQVELDVVEHLRHRHIHEHVAVLLSDHSAIAFYVDREGGILCF